MIKETNLTAIEHPGTSIKESSLAHRPTLEATHSSENLGELHRLAYSGNGQHLPVNDEDLIVQIGYDLDAGRFQKAGVLLAEKIGLLLERAPIVQIQALLAAVPTAVTESNADFCYSTGIMLIRSGQLDEAVAQLMRARTLYSDRQCQSQAIHCAIDIARLYCSQENFCLAFQYLTNEAQPLIDKSNEIKPAVRAYYWLQMAHLATDIGQLHVSTDYGQQALTLYAAIGDLPGQFRSQLRIARNFMQCGNYTEAHARLQLVHQYFHIGKLGAASEGQLLNAEIHLRWCRGQFDDAIRLTQFYLKLADREELRNARLYARILLANLYRDSHHYERATEWYDETQHLITELDQRLYQPWLDAQKAWLFILQGELDQALHYSAQSLQTTDWGQRMSFQVEKAVLYLLQGRIVAAEKLLQQSLLFYESSGDPLASCAIRIYLAYGAIKRTDIGALLLYLEQIFECFARLAIDLLPYWWHPPIIAEVCCQAIVADIYPATVKDIITKSLGQQSIHALAGLLYTEDLDTRQQAQQLLGAITGQNMTILAHLEDSAAKQILQEQLENGHLQPEGYQEMEAELVTAKQRRHPNTTLLAVFALHTRGVKRSVIAQQLDCSLENVRNYITIIYHYFELPAADFHSREQRRQRLIKIARERGYLA